MQEAVIVSAVRTATGKAPGGTLRGTRPDELAAAVIAEALRRAPGARSVGDRRRDSRMRDAGSRAGAERRADREPARRRAGDGVGRHDQPLLLVRPAGDRVRRRAHHVRLRVGDRRRRHRVDEPGADGRQQDRAEPDAGRSLPGRVPHDRPRRREPRARVGHLARGAGRVRAAEPSARDRRDRRRTLQGRNRAARGDVRRSPRRRPRAG